MKICPACHQETFDGRRTCHRCGSDVSRVRVLELPSADLALLLRRGPFRSQPGTLHLDLHGLRFADRRGRTVVDLPARAIRAVTPRGSRDLVVHHGPAAGRARIGFRVHWAPLADRTPVQPAALRLEGMRAFVQAPTHSGRKPGPRDLTVARDRWASSLQMLLQADRYFLDRPP